MRAIFIPSQITIDENVRIIHIDSTLFSSDSHIILNPRMFKYDVYLLVNFPYDSEYNEIASEIYEEDEILGDVILIPKNEEEITDIIKEIRKY